MIRTSSYSSCSMFSSPPLGRISRVSRSNFSLSIFFRIAGTDRKRNSFLPSIYRLRESKILKLIWKFIPIKKNIKLQFDPQGRINILRKKLEGCHPSDILFEELSAHQNSRIVRVRDKYLKKLLNGDKETYRNAVCKNEDGNDEIRSKLSVEAQVECLIDLATDPNVCIRSWQGLQLHL